MGRITMETLSGFDLSPEQWPYGDARIVVLSHSLSEPPGNLKDEVELYAGNLPDLVSRLEAGGVQHAYVDGGKTICSFLNLNLINDITLTAALVLLSDGISLFEQVSRECFLAESEAIVYPNGFVQLKYALNAKRH